MNPCRYNKGGARHEVYPSGPCGWCGCAAEELYSCPCGCYCRLCPACWSRIDYRDRLLRAHTRPDGNPTREATSVRTPSTTGTALQLEQAPDEAMGVEDPRHWATRCLESAEVVAGLAMLLRSALEDPEIDLGSDAYADLWRTVPCSTPLDLARAVYTLARVTTRLAITGPATPCAECGEVAVGTCLSCDRPICGDHRHITITAGEVRGLCPGCTDDACVMLETQQEQREDGSA